MMTWKVKIAESGNWDIVDHRGSRHRLWAGIISERREDTVVTNLVVGPLMISVDWVGTRGTI